MLLEIFWVYLSFLSGIFTVIYLYTTKNNFLWGKFFLKLLSLNSIIIIIIIGSLIYYKIKNCFFSSILVLTPNNNIVENIYSNIWFRLFLIMLLFFSFTLVLLLLSTKEKNINSILLIFFSFVGFVMILSSVTWIQLFFSIELATLPLYILISLEEKSFLSFEAAIKYFITSAVLSSFFIIFIGICLKNDNFLIIYLPKIFFNESYFIYLYSSITIITVLLAKLPVFLSKSLQ